MGFQLTKQPSGTFFLGGLQSLLHMFWHFHLNNFSFSWFRNQLRVGSRGRVLGVCTPPEMKPPPSHSLLKFVCLISQLCHSLVNNHLLSKSWIHPCSSVTSFCCGVCILVTDFLKKRSHLKHFAMQLTGHTHQDFIYRCRGRIFNFLRPCCNLKFVKGELINMTLVWNKGKI